MSTIAGNGDYYRVSKEFQFGNEIAHIGDILVSLINFPAQTPEYWDLIHLEDRVQPDWQQTDTAAADFIKNKPILAPIAISGLIEDLEMLWDTELIFDGGDAGSHEPIALVGTTKLV